jgi:hypothetical protein
MPPAERETHRRGTGERGPASTLRRGSLPGWQRSLLGLALWIGSAFPAVAQTPPPAVSAELLATRLADAQKLLQLRNAPAAATLLSELWTQSGEALPAAHRSEILYLLGVALSEQGELRPAERGRPTTARHWCG